MVNRPKAKGTFAETAILRYVRGHGFPFAERLTLTGSADRGDVALVPGPAVIVESKNVAGASTGQPAPAALAKWLAETEAERLNAGADVAILVVKRKGVGPEHAGRWWAYWRLGALMAFTGHADAVPNPGAPVCMTLDSALALIRHAGYGHPLSDDSHDVGEPW